jgi:type IV fimbrial biogenesis protein FimT
VYFEVGGYTGSTFSKTQEKPDMSPVHDNPRPCKGTTLLELVFVLAIAALVISIAVPAGTTLARENRLMTATNEMVALLHTLRHRAMSSGTPVSFCPSDDLDRCAGHNVWSAGMVAYQDLNHNRQREDNETLTSIHQGFNDGIRVISQGQRKHLTFYRSGRTPGSNATLLICDRHGSDSARAIILSNSGRIRTVLNRSLRKPYSCPAPAG